MKKILAMLLAATMSVTMLVGCSSSGGSDELVMTTNAAFPPFEYVTDGDQVAGVDADIAQAIADKMGKTLKIDNVTFDGALTAVASGKADMAIAGITITEERKKSMDFSEPYTTSVQYIIVSADSDVAVFEDLAGKKMGVQLGTTGDIFCDEAINGGEDDDGNPTEGLIQNTGAELVTYKTALEAALDLQNGKLDAVIIDKLPAENIVASNEGLKTFELTYNNGETTTEEYAVAVKKGNDELLAQINEVINELKANGTIEEMILEHTGATKVD